MRFHWPRYSEHPWLQRVRVAAIIAALVIVPTVWIVVLIRSG